MGGYKKIRRNKGGTTKPIANEKPPFSKDSDRSQLKRSAELLAHILNTACLEATAQALPRWDLKIDSISVEVNLLWADVHKVTERCWETETKVRLYPWRWKPFKPRFEGWQTRLSYWTIQRAESAATNCVSLVSQRGRKGALLEGALLEEWIRLGVEASLLSAFFVIVSWTRKGLAHNQ